MYILGLESSCDETSAAVIEMDMTASPQTRRICSNIVASQIEVHRLYGGVVPEIAGRAHIEAITRVTTQALEEAGIPSLSDNYYRGHISRSIDHEIMESCDVIVGITSEHAVRLIAAYPQYASKITCFPEDIPDPFGGSLEQYKACLAAIQKGIIKLFFPEEDHE